jgi:ABC-type polysaccharide/polyol phosphate export permease
LKTGFDDGFDIDVTDQDDSHPDAHANHPLAVSAPAVADLPPPELRYRRRMTIPQALREAWAAREITRSLAERSIRSRYKQAVLGFAWSLLTPLILMVAFTVLFKRVASGHNLGVPSNVPYPLFSYIALVPWTFFSNSIGNASTSIIGNITLINKVPCPREVFPLSGVAMAAFDAVLSLIALVVLFAGFTFMPRPTSYWVPLILLIMMAFVVGTSILCSVLVVYVRDLRTALPLALQFGLFVTPIAYGFSVIPRSIRGIYSVINPLGPTIESLRRTVLYGLAPQGQYLALAALGATVYLVGGYWLFKRMEAGIADIA